MLCFILAAGQPQLEIRPHGDSFVRALDSHIVLTCDVANIGAQVVDIQLKWFNQHGVEIVDVAAPGRLLAILCNHGSVFKYCNNVFNSSLINNLHIV